MDINFGEVAAQAIAFTLVFIVLRWKAWGPIQGALQARREKIKSDFDKIEVATKEIEALKAEYAGHLQRIDDEARAKIQEAIEEGRRIAKEVQDKARGDAQKEFEKSKENLSIEMAKARVTLRNEIADLSMLVAEKVVKEKMSADAHHAKALEIIEELEKANQ